MKKQRKQKVQIMNCIMTDLTNFIINILNYKQNQKNEN